MEEKIRDCPICKARSRYYSSVLLTPFLKRYYVQCLACYYKSKPSFNRKKALKNWNECKEWKNHN